MSDGRTRSATWGAIAMAYSHYERLSGVDAMFLRIEEPNVHMHVGAVAIFEAGPLGTASGGLDFPRIRASVESALGHSPRFRQKLESVPLLEHPVWVDDHSFNIDYHVRHTSLPKPGSIRLLKRLAGRLMSQKLDRGNPLWEMWVVEGVEEDRFALLLKAHHCMVDGISGFDLLVRILRLDTNATIDPARIWVPRAPPSGNRLLADELLRRAALPANILRAGAAALFRPRETLANLQEAALDLGEVLRVGLKPTTPNPLNPDIGPHRRFNWLRCDLDELHETRARLGGTLNDLVLAITAGAIRRFLINRGVRVKDLVFRAQVPMSIRTEVERGSEGNRIVMLLADLPLSEPDPRKRLERVIETTQQLKRSRQRAGVELLEDISDRVLSSVFVYFARLASRRRSFNVVVTNVPGPPRPVYLLGSRMLEIYPLVPLAMTQGVGIALFSYDGGLLWGVNADREALPDLHSLVSAIDREVGQLCELAASAPASKAAAGA
jgi:WS/DGAT/MGAT family acyltransferase